MIVRQETETVRYPAMAALTKNIGEARRELIRSARAARAEAARCPVSTEAEEFHYDRLCDSAASDEELIGELDALSSAIENWRGGDV